MPFDPIPRRIDIAPPTLGEGGGPVRVVINIEVVQRPPARPQGRSRGMLAVLVWALVLAMLGLAHAQPPPTYEHWQDSRTGWHGQVRREGNTTDWDAYGPDGRQRTCHSYQSGQDRYTTCR